MLLTCYGSFHDLKNTLLIVIVAVVTKVECLMHDFERNINDRILKQLFVDYPRQCLGCELKVFHNNV